MQFDPTKKPTYIFHHPFRFVKPYPHIYQTHAKKRWLGRDILSVLTKQFQAYSPEYFQHALLAGKIQINHAPVPSSYILRNSDLLTHETIRQEPPILNLPIEILHDDQDFLVVNKPPSMIVHTGGGYHYNTLMAILHYEMGYKGLYVLHRIDRLTSGVVILAKRKEKTGKFHEESMEEVMKKSYYARVGGDVGFEEKTVEAEMVCLSHKQGIWGIYNPQTMPPPPAPQTPKQSTTKFHKIWYDPISDSSLLECVPITGRTHQIRVHLAYIGHPILNDVGYGGRFVGNWVVGRVQEMRRVAREEEEVVDRVEKRVKVGGVVEQEKGKQKQQEKQKENESKNLIEYDKWDYKTKPLEICLHSFRYKFEGKQYISRKPYWVDPEAIKSSPELTQQQKKQQGHKPRSKYQLNFLAKNTEQKIEYQKEEDIKMEVAKKEKQDQQLIKSKKKQEQEF